jgi:hypothetical protein
VSLGKDWYALLQKGDYNLPKGSKIRIAAVNFKGVVVLFFGMLATLSAKKPMKFPRDLFVSCSQITPKPVSFFR